MEELERWLRVKAAAWGFQFSTLSKPSHLWCCGSHCPGWGSVIKTPAYMWLQRPLHLRGLKCCHQKFPDERCCFPLVFCKSMLTEREWGQFTVDLEDERECQKERQKMSRRGHTEIRTEKWRKRETHRISRAGQFTELGHDIRTAVRSHDLHGDAVPGHQLVHQVFVLTHHTLVHLQPHQEEDWTALLYTSGRKAPRQSNLHTCSIERKEVGFQAWKWAGESGLGVPRMEGAPAEEGGLPQWKRDNATRAWRRQFLWRGLK